MAKNPKIFVFLAHGEAVCAQSPHGRGRSAAEGGLANGEKDARIRRPAAICPAPLAQR